MVNLTFPALRFYVQRARHTQPVAVVAAVSGVAMLATAGVLLALQVDRLYASRVALARLSEQAKPSLNVDRSANVAEPNLPPFASAPFVAALGDAAAESGVTLDEVRYALEDSAGMPFLRYRVTLGVAASYPLVRKMAERIQSTMPNATIDTIHCARKSPLLAELTCELALSGLFRKTAAHG